MLMKYFYDAALAHASYLVGCQRSGTALVVDPGRDIDEYLAVAKANGMKVVGVAETHIHADYVSGARELADRVGATLYVSDAGPSEWKYQFLTPYSHQLLQDGDSFSVGNIRFDVLHTPGHTPESLSFLLTDVGGGATEPMGLFSGDFVFVGSIGRPDLLEEAAGVVGSAAEGAKALYQSVQRFKQLPDYLQLWPAHGAGSACGKGLGAIPSSTVGYEKRFNPALQIEDESAFVDYILADQPEAPKYFAVMKRVNKVGPAVVGPTPVLTQLSISEFTDRADGAQVIDLARRDEFRVGHAPGSWNIPVPTLAAWAGWLLDYDRPGYLIADPEQLPEAMRVLRKIGYDGIQGYFNRRELVEQGLASEQYVQQSPAELRDMIETEQVQLWDVRSNDEWKSGHIPGATHRFLGKLRESAGDCQDARPIVLQCQAGTRSAIAASVLQASGHQVIDMSGGYLGWVQAGLPVTTDAASATTCSA